MTARRLLYPVLLAVAVVLPRPAPAQSPASAPVPTSPAPAGPTQDASYGTNDSVMFSDSEFFAIKKAIADHDHPIVKQHEEIAAQATAEKEESIEAARRKVPNVYLSAVMDFGGGDWTVWANGLRVTPDHQPALFQVVGVRGNAVDFVVPGDGGDKFELQPYQTWRSQQRDVVEGIYP